jgi:hypothetical protein
VIARPSEIQLPHKERASKTEEWMFIQEVCKFQALCLVRDFSAVTFRNTESFYMVISCVV